MVHVVEASGRVALDHVGGGHGRAESRRVGLSLALARSSQRGGRSFEVGDGCLLWWQPLRLVSDRVEKPA